MKLRAWQSASIDRALNHFYSHKHFLCLATPGAGKTTMAAELAGRLINKGAIDFVLCFAPSLTVVSSLENTFATRLGRRFDGRIGALGGAYTYQGMRSLGDQFWKLFESHRVLVVFDEIHHCAGDENGGANAWGEEILLRIQHRATYTLALTGTPWRSDNRPIVLAEYSNPEGDIQCDYIYGLKEAIRDQVCRKPSIVLIDNERMKVKKGNQNLEYNGVNELLERSDIRYQELLHNDEALRFCLSLGCSQLAALRRCTPDAGGLVVASSVLHAESVARILQQNFEQSVSIVTYKHRDSDAIIEQFRQNDQQWIVSVGMISEGTDIPRLQVCCHLSRITTELYFRQVLGRVLRVTRSSPDTAWLYTFAEPKLVEFAERIVEDIPTTNAIKFVSLAPGSAEICAEPGPSKKVRNGHSALMELTNSWAQYPSDTGMHVDSSAINDLYTLECLGSFRQRLVGFFENDLSENPALS